MEEDNHEYIWEIKPYSFANEDKKLEGEMQLQKYINVNPNYYLKCGLNQYGNDSSGIILFLI